MRCLFVFSVVFIVSAQGEEIHRAPLIISQGGTPEKPEVFDGQGMIIDLGIDVTTHDWQKYGDVWTSRGPFGDHPMPNSTGGRAALFIEEVPLRIARDRMAEKNSGVPGKVIFVAPEALKPGEMGFTTEGEIYFRWPSTKTPGSARIILPPLKLASGVSITCSHIIVRNITAIHAANDGFNIHADRIGVRLENVKAFSNGDEGISAHETVQMDVVNSEIAWNYATGVADVGDSITTYTNCKVHDNHAGAFYFGGKSHKVTNSEIYGHEKDFRIGKDLEVVTSGVEWRRKKPDS